MSYKHQDEAPSPLPTRKLPPRVNVVVTEEQHALLLELASLEKGTSASGFLRELLNRVTPLLRKTVPMMRAAHQARGEASQELRQAVAAFMGEMQQLDLLDAPGGPGGPDAATEERGPARPGSQVPRRSQRK